VSIHLDLLFRSMTHHVTNIKQSSSLPPSVCCYRGAGDASVACNGGVSDASGNGGAGGIGCISTVGVTHSEDEDEDGRAGGGEVHCTGGSIRRDWHS
jgi:hypothetical protein